MVTTNRPFVRKRFAGIQFRVNEPHEETRSTEKRRVAERARALLSRSMIVSLPGLSSQTRNRAYTRRPTHFSDRKVIDGALLPCTVVEVVTVVWPATTPEALDAVVATPSEVCAVTSARSR